MSVLPKARLFPSSREEELDYVRRRGRALNDGSGTLLFWAGAPGIGKSFMLSQAIAIVQEACPEADFLHLTGASLATDSLGPILAAMGSKIGITDQSILAELRYMGPPEDTPDISAQVNRMEMLLSEYLGDQILFVSVNDISIERSTVFDLLIMLAPLLDKFPIFVALTTTSHTPHSFLKYSEHNLHITHVPPVTPQEACVLLQSESPTPVQVSLTGQLWERCAGNPGDILAAFNGLTPAQATSSAHPPEALSLNPVTIERWRDKLRHMEGEHALLVATAISTDRSINTLQKATSCTNTQIEAPDGSPAIEITANELGFTRPSYREAVLTATNAMELPPIHSLLAEATTDPYAAAWHTLKADKELDKQGWARLLEFSRNSLANGDLDLSLEISTLAGEIAQDPVIKASFQVVCGLASAHFGYLNNTVQSLGDGLANVTDVELLNSAVLELGWITGATGDAVGEGLFWKGLEKLEKVSALRAHSALQFTARIIYSFDNSVTPAQIFCDRADELYERTKGSITPEEATECQAQALYTQAVRTSDYSAIVNTRFGVPKPPTSRVDLAAWEVILRLPTQYMALGDRSAAISSLSYIEHQLQRTPSPLFGGLYLLQSLHHSFVIGNLRTSEALLRNWVYRVPLNYPGLEYALELTAYALVYLGYFDEANQWLNAVRSISSANPASGALAQLPAISGLLAALQGDFSAASDRYGEAIRNFDDMYSRKVFELRFALALTRNAGGHRTAGRNLLRDLPKYQEFIDSSELVKCKALLVRAVFGPTEDIVENITGVFETFGAGISPLSEAELTLTAAQAISRMSAKEHQRVTLTISSDYTVPGQADHLQLLVSKALNLALQAGATGLANYIRSNYDRLTSEESAGGDSGESSQLRGQALTDQELKVARMVAQGASNKQVASAMFLSVRTVELRLTTVYRKLGIGSRKALAGAMAQLGEGPGHLRLMQ